MHFSGHPRCRLTLSLLGGEHSAQSGAIWDPPPCRRLFPPLLGECSERSPGGAPGTQPPNASCPRAGPPGGMEGPPRQGCAQLWRQ